MTSLRVRAEFAAPLLLALIGVAAVIGGVGYGINDDHGRVGSGFLPLAAGAALAILALAELRETRRRQVAEALGQHHKTLAEVVTDIPEETLERDEPGVDILGRSPAQRVRILVTVLVLVTIAVALVPVLGFLISFGLLLFAVTAFVEQMGVLRSAAVTVATIAVLWYLFAQFLSIPLPQGLLGVI
jgi:putative tricarboxylic transport membrane protein